MIIAVASGKGGTGKTTVAANLAKTLTDRRVTLIDCDVEEPNCHLFINPAPVQTEPHTVYVPSVDKTACTACGACSTLCQFKAIITIKDSTLVFPELCHSCRGCEIVCPENAISEGSRETGQIHRGESDHITLVWGSLRIGEAMAVPLISSVLERGTAFGRERTVIIDAPPGTSCPVIEAVKGADFTVLVTEPTPFGLHDLKLAAGMTRKLSLPMGVVINRSTSGDRGVHDFCRDEAIPVLLEIPDDRRIAEAYSNGILMVDALPEYREQFRSLLETITRKAAGR
ncbi:ATP-binding protein [bacterium]|nr:ATP-binding protein [bacterium]